jgi:hypothetical protein
LASGYKIADEIGANEDQNTTGKWIAHYLAERLEEANTDPSQADECFELILKLWESRRNWPSGDPISQYDALLPKLHMLLQAEGRFFGSYTGDVEHTEEADKLLQIALRVDQLSSALIWDLVKDSVEKTGIFDDDWLADATETASDPQTEFLVKIKKWAEESPPDINKKILGLRQYLEGL